MPQGLSKLRYAAPADFQRLVAMTQHGLGVAIADAAQLDDLIAGNQAISVDAHEAVAELGLQRLQRFLNQVLAARVVHDHVFLVSLQVMDI